MLTLVGVMAGVLTTGAWLPQLVKCWRTRSAGDLSWSYLGVLGTGVAMWALYGLMSSDMVLILANVITILALVILVVFKIAFGRLARDLDQAAV